MISDLLTVKEVKEMSEPEILHWGELFAREQQTKAIRKVLLDYLEVAEAEGAGNIIPYSEPLSK